MNIYCQKCGKPTEYSINKPRFCAFCANSFELSIGKTCSLPQAVPSASPAPSPLPPKEMDYSLDEEDDSEPIIESASQMNIEIIGRTPKKTKIEQIATGTKINLEEIRSLRPRNKKISKKKFLEQFAQQAGALKPHSRIHKVKNESE